MDDDMQIVVGFLIGYFVVAYIGWWCIPGLVVWAYLKGK